MDSYAYFKTKADSLRRMDREFYVTNVIAGYLSENDKIEFIENDKAIICWFEDKHRVRAFFATCDLDCLFKLLVNVPYNVVIENIYKDKKGDPLKDYFLRAGFDLYATLTKYLSCWTKNPYKIPEEGRRALLQELYDPEFGEYPLIEDADELYELNNRTFDKYRDDFPSLDEWKSIINEKNCLIHRENGEIVTYYVWKPEGKMLYSRISVNVGPANYLYNLERRIFEEYWDKGIRIYYCWIDNRNKKQHKRSNRKADKYLKYKQRLYDAVYKK